MKKFLMICFSFLFFSLNSNAQVSNADTMVHRIFAVLKSGDEKKLLALFPDYIQMKSLMKDVLMKEQTNVKTEEDRKIADSSVNEFLKEITEDVYKNEMQKQFLESFTTILEKGKEDGINWKNIELIKYTIDSIPFSESKVKAMNGILAVKEGTKTYNISFDQVIWDDQKKGWFGVSFKDMYLASDPLK